MSTSELQKKVSQYLSTYFGKYTIRENQRPNWLITDDGARLELDFFVEELKLGIEVQGEQHFAYSQHFHGTPDGFHQQLKRDRIKSDLCQANGIELIEISGEDELSKLHRFLRRPKEKAIQGTPEERYIAVVERMIFQQIAGIDILFGRRKTIELVERIVATLIKKYPRGGHDEENS